MPAALATLDADQHALAVDIGDLERRDLGHAQAGAIGHRQGRLMLEGWFRPGAAEQTTGTWALHMAAGAGWGNSLECGATDLTVLWC